MAGHERTADSAPDRLARKLRVSLATLLGVMTLCAPLVMAGRWIYDWYFTVPPVPTWALAYAVDRFNEEASRNPVGKHEPPLTEAEVITAIRSQLPSLRPEVARCYAKIADSTQVPVTADLYPFDSYQDSILAVHTVWWINLNLDFGNGQGYGLRIRENSSPVAAAQAAPDPPAEAESHGP